MPRNDISAFVAEAAADVPDRQALVESGGRSLTWAALEDEVARIATGLGVHGIRAGQRVMIAVGNRIEFVTAYLGVLRAQVVAVPVNPRSAPGEVARMVADSGTRLVIADATALDVVREGLAELAADGEVPAPIVVVVGAEPGEGEHAFAELRADVVRPVPPLPDPEKLAALLYTSGTSGRPRAAMLSHRALLANIEQVAAVEPPMMHGDDVVLGVLPLFHVYGLNAVLGGVLRHRARLLLVEKFDPQAVLDLIDDEACSVVPIAPPAFAHWLPDEHLRERLGPVRLVLSGSAPLEASVIEEFTGITGIPVHQGYGLTEASPVVTSTLCSADPAPGSVGAALARHRAAPGRRDVGPGRGRGPRPDPGPRRQPLLRLLARRRGRPRRRGLVRHRRRRLPRRRGRPLPRRPGQGADHRQRLQRLPHRGRGRDPRGRRRHRRRRHRCSRTPRPARPWWRTSSRRGR